MLEKHSKEYQTKCAKCGKIIPDEGGAFMLHMGMIVFGPMTTLKMHGMNECSHYLCNECANEMASTINNEMQYDSPVVITEN